MFLKKSIELAALTDQVTRILKRDIQLGAVSISQQVCTLDDEGVLVCRSLGHLAELKI